MRLSLVIPCYNEREGIPQLALALEDVRRALEPVYRLELVFVDDGSTDGTCDVLERHCGALPDTRIISHERNRGLGAALRTGFAHATGEWVATTDSDCTYDLRRLPDMISLMELGADVVVASPYHPAGAVRNVPRYRLFLSQNLSRLYSLVLGSRVYTYTSLFRIYRADLVRGVHFESDGFLSMAELLVAALRRGARVVEFPTVLAIRNYGESKAAIARLIGQHVSFLGRLLLLRLSGRLWAKGPSMIAEPGSPKAEVKHIGVAPFREAPPDNELARWNRELNRTHGMSVLTEHPNLLVRWHERDRKRRILRMVRPCPTDLVVEVGCERGGLSSRIVGSCGFLVCVDIDFDVLADAREQLRGWKVGFVVADAQALPLKSQCADIGVSSDTLAHLPNPAMGLRELARVTCPEGYLALNVPNESWILFLKRIVFQVLRGARAFRGISPGLAPGHLWVFHPRLFRKICDGNVRLGPLSFNIPFFTHIFVIARPVRSPDYRNSQTRRDSHDDDVNQVATG